MGVCQILKIQSMGLLDGLLVDKTTKQNIIWTTDAYNGLGEAFDRDSLFCLTYIRYDDSEEDGEGVSAPLII